MKKIKGFAKKHKIITTLIAAVLVIAITGTALFATNRKSDKQEYSFVRTTTLQKGTLEDSISTTGTVSSAKKSTVTTSLNYTVKSVNVSVGDTVKKGDTLVTLDTEELENQIEKEEQNLAKSLSSAQTQYNSANSSYADAKSKLGDYASTLSSAKSAYNSAKTPYNTAVKGLKTYQSAYSKALAAYNTAGAKYITAMAEYNTAVSKFKSGSISKAKLQSAAKKYMKAVQNAIGGCAVGTVDISDGSSSTSQSAASGDNSDKQANTGNTSQSSTSSSSVSITQTANDICRGVVSQVYTLTGKTLAVPSGSNTLYKLAVKAKSLRSAKTSSNYDLLESNYTTAKSAYEQAKSTYDQYKSEVTQAAEQLTQAKDALENASSSDTLTELKSQLDDCKLTAKQDGTVTALSATVGAVCNKDSVATVQDLDSLQVDITIPEADINNAKLEQACHITSDASDETLDGKITQIDPTSSDGTFGAKVKITSKSTELHIGMNASVDIIVSSSENVYQVPIDAVGKDGDTNYVYRKTSGEGTDMQFEKVTVTTGDSNDYYVEISSVDLAAGDVIRSNSDLSEGIETVSDKEKESNSGGLLSSLFGGSNGGGRGDMPQGGPQGSGNNRSDSNSNSSGGDMPSPPSGDMGGGQNG